MTAAGAAGAGMTRHGNSHGFTTNVGATLSEAITPRGRGSKDEVTFQAGSLEVPGPCLLR